VRILLQQGEKLLRFVKLEVTERDGSVILAFPTKPSKGAVRGFVSTKGGAYTTTETDDEPSESFKLTLHSSGRINFGGRHPAIFVGPLWSLAKASPVLVRRVGRLSSLTELNRPVANGDVILDLAQIRPPLSFEIAISPEPLPADDGPRVQVELLKRLFVTFRLVDIESLVPANLVGATSNFYPNVGTLETQAIGEDLALIEYHKLLHGKASHLPVGPNNVGEYRLVFQTQMRVAPDAVIKALNPDVEAEVIDQTRDPRTNRVQVRFRFVERKSGRVIKTPVEIAEVTLSAEL